MISSQLEKYLQETAKTMAKTVLEVLQVQTLPVKANIVKIDYSNTAGEIGSISLKVDLPITSGRKVFEKLYDLISSNIPLKFRHQLIGYRYDFNQGYCIELIYRNKYPKSLLDQAASFLSSPKGRKCDITKLPQDLQEKISRNDNADYETSDNSNSI